MVKLIILSVLLAFGYTQDTCIYYADNPQTNTQYVFNLTSISRWTLEYKTPQHAFYYTPCRNGLQCQQGAENFAANVAQFRPGANQCEHYLAVDNHETAEYSFNGNSWRFQYQDGELCDITQQPRNISIYYHCNDVNNKASAFVESVTETSPCNYYMSIKSTLACVHQNDFNQNCQWKELDSNGDYQTLDLSSLQGEIIHAPWKKSNGYEFYYSVCSNKLHCWQQGESQTMAVVDNRETGTCELNLGVWEGGNTHPFVRDSHNPPHWTFHYWNGDKCSDGRQAEFRIMWFCDEEVDTYKILASGVRDDCDLYLNLSTKLACFQQDKQKKKWIPAKQAFV